MVDKLVIYQKLYDVIVYVFPILNRMPKSQRFVLAYEHAQGNLSLEQYIVAGQQVQAIHEDSLAGYQAVAGVAASGMEIEQHAHHRRIER